MTSNKRLISTLTKSIAFLSAFLLIFSVSMAQTVAGDHHDEHHADQVEETHTEPFNAGEMIMEHIGDAHDWHIVGDLSLPLPVIVYHSERGFSFFLSSEFHHGHDAAHGYRVWTKEYAESLGMSKDAHKINALVAVDANGNYDEAATAGIMDFSITKNVAALLFSIIVMLWIILAVAKGYRTNHGRAPKGIQALVEPIIVFVRDDIAKASIGHKYEKFMPFLLTIFFFIWINNVLGLIPILPGGANVTGNIAVPLVLATLTFIITTINGKGTYWKHIFAMPGVPIAVLPLVTVLEVAGMFIKPLVLMIRLFANITAGHIAMLVFFSLIFIAGEAGAAAGYGVSVAAVAFTVFLNFLELLVGFIQAYVFTLLAAIYFGMAVQEDHH